MSRSRRRTPVAGITRAESDKPFKQAEHQRERSAVRDALASGVEDMPDPKAYGNPWASPKDGKRRYADPKIMRK